jgi:hypothetical protein
MKPGEEEEGSHKVWVRKREKKGKGEEVSEGGIVGMEDECLVSAGV